MAVLLLFGTFHHVSVVLKYKYLPPLGSTSSKGCYPPVPMAFFGLFSISKLR